MTLLNNANRKWWVLIGVSIASFMGCLDFTIVNTALPAIQSALNTSVNQLQWIINIFILALSTMMVIMGRLADMYGRRKLLYIGVVVFGLSSLGAGLSPTIEWLIFFRLIQGMACAILYTASGAIVSNAFPEDQRGKAIGLLFGVNGIGLAVGPVLGGIIVAMLSWRWVFLVNVPVIAVCLIICGLSVQESRNEEQEKHIDWPGFIVLIIALPCLILAITQGETWGWCSLITLGLFSVSLVMFILFYVIETKTTKPIIQFQLFANRIFISSIAATFSLAFFYCLAFFLMPLYLHGIRNESDFIVGLMLLPTTAMVAILSPVAGKLVDSQGSRLIIVCGFALFAISAFMQAQFDAQTSISVILSSFLFMGAGWACILGPSTVASLSSVPESLGAVAMGSAWTMHNIGGAIGLSSGVAIYHFFANKTVLSDLNLAGIPTGSWVNQVVSDPDSAISLLKQYTNLTPENITSVFHHFFMNGYQAAMCFLGISSVITLLIVYYGMRTLSSSGSHLVS